MYRKLGAVAAVVLGATLCVASSAQAQNVTGKNKPFSFGGSLGFTPLAEGLAQLGLKLCTEPDCGLVPPVR